MVLRPISPAACPTVRYEPRPGALPAWVAIAERQKQCAESWWLVAQPDHANLSGELAANFVSPKFPRINPAVAKAIALHDAGWAMFPAEADPTTRPMISDDFKPRSFIEFPPGDFLRAWTGSIEHAEAVAPIGGVIVSRHFCALGEFRLREKMDEEADAELVRGFLKREESRQKRLSADGAFSPEEASDLLKVLQFCDVLSLYLCCGASEEVEFPQRFAGSSVTIKRSDDFYVLTPSPFQTDGQPLRTVSLGVPARKYPDNGNACATTLPFLLQ